MVWLGVLDSQWGEIFFEVARDKPCFEMKMTKDYSKILLMKSSRNNFILFTCILPDYMVHESIKELWKNNHFENMRADFLRRCQNSLRQTSPEMMHF